MGDRTGISWADATWNPVVGCSRTTSKACEHCYAIRDVNRMAGHPNAKVAAANAGLTKWKGGATDGFLDWSGEVRTFPDRLTVPLRWKRPRRIFVNSLSDLFHPSVPDEFIDRVFAVMALVPQHSFQVLTKRPERMLRYCLNRMDMVGPVFNLLVSLGHLSLSDSAVGVGFGSTQWPLPNVWLGVSVEDQKTADERIPLLLQTPAAVRFLSIEPLLGQIILAKSDLDGQCDHPCQEYLEEGSCGCTCISGPWKHNGKAWPAIDWVIVGGESGPGARPMHPDWVRSIRDQCQAAEVPFFFKQWGDWSPVCAQYPQTEAEHDEAEAASTCGDICISNDGYIWQEGIQPSTSNRPWLMDRVGKKAAGRLLDGRVWDELPETCGKEVAVVNAPLRKNASSQPCGDIILTKKQ